MAAQAGTFTASFDAIPLQDNQDAIVALSPGLAGQYSDLAAIVRFNDTGTLDARDGGVYSAGMAVAYGAGISYHVRMVVNVPNHTYSVFVTPAGQSEVLLASNYAFRSEQATATSLTYWVKYALVGGSTVTNFTLSGAGTLSACDVNGDAATNVVDVQLAVNQALGVTACAADINNDGVCNVIDVQRVVNAALGGQCVSP